MICEVCGKKYGLPEAKFSFIRRDSDTEAGLDMDYVLVTGDHPVNRPDDWSTHDSSLYKHKKEYIEYATDGTYTLPNNKGVQG